MNCGHFFALDIDATCLNEKVAVFHYIDLPAYIGIKYPMSPQYPVSVVITNNSVKFMLHYCVYRTEKSDEDERKLYEYSYELPLPMPKGTKIIHMEEELFELPYSAGSERLTATIKKLYNSKFPIPISEDKYNKDLPSANYMAYLLGCRYEDADKQNKSLSLQSLNKSLEPFRRLDRNRICYSSLYVYGLREKKGMFVLKNSSGVYNKFLRKLFLDFVFDMVHSDIFCNSAFFDAMRDGLYSNFFFSAIRSKSEFYYQRAIVSSRFCKDWEQTGNNRAYGETDNIYKIYAEYLDRAERHWLKHIQSPEADSQFHFVPNWYEQKDEYPLLDRIRNSCKRACYSLYHNILKVANASWFMDTETEMHRVLFNHSAYVVDAPKNMDVIHMNEVNNSRQFANMLNKRGSKEIEERYKKVSLWLFKHYHFADAFALVTFKHFNNLLFVPLLCVLASCLLFPQTFTSAITGAARFFDDIGISISKTGINGLSWRNLSWIIMCIFIIGWYIRYMLSWFSDRYRWRSYAGTQWRSLVNKGCLLGLIFIIPYMLDANTDLVVIKWIATGIMGVLVYANIRRILPNYIHLAFPRLVAAIAAAWFTIALSEDLYKAFFDMRFTWVSSLLILLMVLVFIYYEINRIIPNVKLWNKLFRSMELILVSFLISIAIGLCVINFTGERMLVRSGILPEFYRENVLFCSGTDETGKERQFKINFDGINKDEVLGADSVIINKYTYLPSSDSMLFSNSEAKEAVKHFATTKYEDAFAERIAVINRKRGETDTLAVDSVMRGRFLARHENDALFKDLLPYVKHTDKGDHGIASFIPIGENGYKLFILYDFLVQFAFVAMFIGIFIQLIFEDKSITET